MQKNNELNEDTILNMGQLNIVWPKVFNSSQNAIIEYCRMYANGQINGKLPSHDLLVIIFKMNLLLDFIDADIEDKSKLMEAIERWKEIN